MRRAFVEAIDEIFAKYDNAILIIGDIGSYMLRNVSAKYPDRIINAGIAEANMMSVAAGMALEGFLPFVYTITPFVTSRCYDQIRVGVGYNGANVKIIGIGSGVSYGVLGATHHSVEDIALMSAIPNMTVISPSDGVETKQAMLAMAEAHGPAYIRLMLNVDEMKIENREPFNIGKAQILKPGKDAFLIATGQLVGETLKAAELLEKENINVGVVNMSTLKPIDADTLVALATTASDFYTIEEHNHTNGLGAIVAMIIAEKGLPVNLTTIGLPDEFIKQYGHKEELYKDFGLDAAGIIDFVKKKSQIANNLN